MASVFSIFSRPYYDDKEKQYYNILVPNAVPAGILGSHTVRVKMRPLSEFKIVPRSNCCQLAFDNHFLLNYNSHICNCNRINYVITDQLTDLIAFLMTNNYEIITNVSDTLHRCGVKTYTSNANQLICMVKYIG
jgi:hypothetical protein